MINQNAEIQCPEGINLMGKSRKYSSRRHIRERNLLSRYKRVFAVGGPKRLDPQQTVEATVFLEEIGREIKKVAPPSELLDTPILPP